MKKTVLVMGVEVKVTNKKEEFLTSIMRSNLKHLFSIHERGLNNVLKSQISDIAGMFSALYYMSLIKDPVTEGEVENWFYKELVKMEIENKLKAGA